ncbi:alanine:cation symporter family protein [Kocuria coralli]|uniref:Alanine:cation symporter family protein n=1 Tax=Kocuria coralli TaxID=1461025 RepID=A0A5J5L2Y3_9MICC|nr:alanine/glycine:cation symporter family protein [Kocuria coralli]KAA9395446.1 alanine:cation symporter family protein [Kocuria coralli]
MDAAECFGSIGGIVWGPFLLIPLLLLTGLYLTIRLGLIQLFKLGPALRLALFQRSDKDAPGGDVSQFQALTTALAATVGTGNIVGVATAISIGGPGALFWMWVTGLLGMASKYSEAFLGVRYRTTDAKGEISGGPQYYLQRGIPNGFGKFLALFFAIAAVLASFGIGNMTQGNSISGNVDGSFGIPSWITGLVLAVLTLAVLVGGIKSIGRVTSAFVPVMIVFYVLGALWILIFNVADIPAAIALIFTDAFSGTAAVGGFAGSALILAIQMGVARGMFSNESGMGSAAIAAASAKTTHPVRQGLVSMTQTFIDTIIVVTCTGLVIITTGVWEEGSEFAATMTGEAFSHGLPGQWGHIIVTLGLVMFAYSTILGWAYYGERCMERLFGRGGVMPYRIFYSCVVFIGATIPLAAVWNFADVMNGLMAIPNLIGLLIMAGLVARETKHYLKNDPKLTAGKSEVDLFMKGHDGGIDTYELTGR